MRFQRLAVGTTLADHDLAVFEIVKAEGLSRHPRDTSRIPGNTLGLPNARLNSTWDKRIV